MNRTTETYAQMLRNLDGYFRQILAVKSKDGRRELRVRAIQLPPAPEADDFEAQKRARSLGLTMSKPITADIELVENGKVTEAKRVTLLSVPEVTQRGTYIMQGTEYSFPIQKRLISGVYTTKNDDGSVKCWINSEAGRNYTINTSPEGVMMVEVVDRGGQGTKTYHMPLYPMLLGLGVTDQQMVKAWGEPATAIQRNARGGQDVDKAIETLYRSTRYETDPEAKTQDVAGRSEWVKNYFQNKSSLDKENSLILLNKPHDRVSPELFLDAGAKSLALLRSEIDEDNKESLLHAQFVDLSDFAVERLNDREYRQTIKNRIARGLESRAKIDDIVYKDIFQAAFNSTFTGTSLARTPKQLNPMDMISGYTEITVRGEGGIQTDQAVTKDVRALDPSHLGFVDPVHTPEGSNIGTTLHVASGARKKGRDLVTRVVDVKTGAEVELTPRQFYLAPIAYSESWDAQAKKLKTERDGTVQVMWRHKDQRVKPSEVKYVMRSISDMLNVNALAIPFLTHNNGTRVMTASKMQAQAKPLKYREPPLVQCTINERSNDTVEQVVGRSFCPKSPVDGSVVAVTESLVTIKGADGKKVEVQIPKKFWLNEGNFVDGVVIVKVGDQVKKGQPLADTNYTKDGTLALGTNLNVAYIPYKGYNHEDGVVISESAATKLTSLHAHQHPIPITASEVLNLKKYMSYFPMSYSQDQLARLDEEGVIKEGQTINPGDPIVVKMRKVEEDVTSKQLRQISRLLASDFRDTSVHYEKDHAGVVSEVTRRRGELFIVITTEERARIGDKLVGRYGNKGTVTLILPDDKMPANDKGAPLDILINPPGVPARMNPGQLLETNASRAAELEGKTFLARPAGENGTAKVEDALKRHKLTDATTIYDPVEAKSIEGVTTGKQYFMKLEHTVEKKLSARGAGDDEAYSLSGQPSSGGGEGGRAVGLGEVYALLAHGANANLRDMYTFKGDKNPEFWRALEKGYPLPPPDQPSSSKRLVGMLRGAGVNIEERDGNAVMTPFLDRDIKKISNGEIKTPGVLRAADLKEEKGGLFDLDLTGGLDGEKWTHIRLAEPMPHPTFEKSILDLTKLKADEFDAIMAGELGVLDGKVVPATERGAKTGGVAVRDLLSRINTEERLKVAEEEAKLATGSELNKLHREIRILRNLRDNGIKPQEFVVDLVPVIPPKFRPVAELPNSDLTIADVNEHYRALVMQNQQVAELKKRPGLSAQEAKAKTQLYDGFRGTMGYSSGLVGKPNVKGLTATIAGTQPKHGWFQNKTIRRRQDMSGTAVVEPEPELSMDTIGVPEEMAWTMYKPLLVRRLADMGLPKIEADKQIQQRGPAAQKAMADVVAKHHVIANRAPTLHRLGVMAFKPKLVPGSAVKLPVEVLTGFNADFDGDTFGLHVVVSEDANEEAKKMLPSNNLYMPGKSRQALAPQITQEFVLGLYRISVPGRTTSHSFATPDQAIKAMESQQIKPNDIITVKGIGPATRTTAGLVAAMSVVPQPLRDYQTPLDKKQIEKILVATQKQHGTAEFVKVMDHFKHLGRRWAFLTGSSILLSDMKSLSRTRDQLYREADLKADKVRRDTSLSQAERDKRLIAIYSEVDQKILSQAKALPPNSTGSGRNNLSDQVVSGARGNPNQVKQIVGTLGLMLDHNQKTIPEPVRGNYVDGLSSRDFFAHAYSQRKGMIDRSQSVIGPGALSKELTNTATRFVISTVDCKTQQGRLENVDRHLLDRVLARNEGGVAKGTVINEVALEQLKKAGLTQAYVRTPLTCEASDGICSMCFGHDETGKFPPVGKNIGVTETQALTERSVQLPMKSFHCNHPKTIVFLQHGDDRYAWTMERLYHTFTSAPYVIDGVEMKWCPPGWMIWDEAGWVPLLRVARHAPDAPMVQVKSKASQLVVCQDNHPLMVRKIIVACASCGSSRMKVEGTGRKQTYMVRCMECDARNTVGKAAWKASRVAAVHAGQIDDVDVLHVSVPPIGGDGATTILDPWLLGFMLAEGSFGVRREKTVKHGASVVRGVVARGGHACTALHFAQLPGDIYDEASRRLGEAGIEHARYPRSLVVHDSHVAQEIMRETCSGAENKEIPSQMITHGTKAQLASLLSGWIDGDGCVLVDQERSSARIVVTSTSLALIQGFHMICSHLGLLSSVDVGVERELTRHQSWSLNIRPRADQAELLSDSLKCRGVEWTATAREDMPPSFDTGVAYVKPLQGSLDMVYDVTTGTGTFCANGVWTHNSGGVATAEGGMADAFSRSVQILRMPETLKVKAVLSTRAGQVQSITPNGVGGHVITVAGIAHTAPSTVKPSVKVGDTVKPGDRLTTGAIKPQELLQLKDLTAVQTQVRDDLHDTFASADVKLHKRTYEIMVRGITDTVRVTDPGDSPNFVTGDYTTYAKVNAWNTQNPTKRQVRFSHEIAGSLTAPKRQEDWATRMALGGIRQTIQEGASMGYKSPLKPGSFASLSLGPGTKIRKPGEEFAPNSFPVRR